MLILPMARLVDLVGGAAIVGAIIAAAVALVTAHLKGRWDAKQLKIAALDAQLSGLYGPVVFLLTQNKMMFDLAAEISAAGAKLGKQLERDEVTGMVEVNNTYAKRASRNNAKIVRLLEQNYHLLDDEDRTVAHSVALDHVRLGVEGSAGRDKARLPVQVAISLDKPIHYMRGEFQDRLLAKFISKQVKVRELRGA